LKWRRVTKLCEQSDCLTYTVAAFRVRGKWIFQAFKGKAFLHIGTAAECKQACEVDRDAR
jgi:hypothetical protein